MIKVNKYLKSKILSIPDSPGIYKMLDKERNIIYIGKSLSLKKRVRTYFSEKNKWAKARKLAPLIADIEYIVTDTHLEARLLECQMIKDIKPIFNSQFKNDKGYVYIDIKDYNIHNPLSIVYDYEANVYGPFRRKFTVLKILESLKNIYPILNIDSSYEFDYKIFPVKMNKELYNLNKQSLEDIFSKDENLILLLAALEQKMKAASSLLKFETAMAYRDIINGLNYLKGSLREDKSLFLQKLFVKIPLDSGCKFFFISRGKIILKEKYDTYDKSDIDNFINKALNIDYIDKSYFEKSSLDFRNIIYSEIRSLPKSRIEIIS